MHQLTRRGFIGGVAALSAAGPGSLWSSPLMAQAGGGGPLPARAEFTIANAYVMTMDPALGDIAGGSSMCATATSSRSARTSPAAACGSTATA